MTTLALIIAFLLKMAVLVGLMGLGAWLAFWGSILGLALRFERTFLLLIACGIALFLLAGAGVAALVMPAALA
ncbi:MAG TPA: hypothetical protein VF503_20375 [Sphingobium sp.]|uniref:hypothetical protein n=1 Tax=Sphingobium sp. TaxID=1912891 RepID=UPI002ED1B7C3